MGSGRSLLLLMRLIPGNGQITQPLCKVTSDLHSGAPDSDKGELVGAVAYWLGQQLSMVTQNCICFKSLFAQRTHLWARLILGGPVSTPPNPSTLLVLMQMFWSQLSIPGPDPSSLAAGLCLQLPAECLSCFPHTYLLQRSVQNHCLPLHTGGAHLVAKSRFPLVTTMRWDLLQGFHGVSQILYSGPTSVPPVICSPLFPSFTQSSVQAWSSPELVSTDASLPCQYPVVNLPSSCHPLGPCTSV